MRSLAGSLLIGIGLLMVSGCVLSDRSFSRASDPSAPQSIADLFSEKSADNRISFKPPARKPLADQVSNNLTANPGSDRVRASNPRDANTVQAGHSVDADVETGSSDSPSARIGSIRANRNFANNRLGSLELTAANQLDQDAGSPGSPVKFQGVEFVDPSNPPVERGLDQYPDFWAANNAESGKARTGNPEATIPNWSDRPRFNSSDKPRKNRTAARRDLNSPLANREPRPIPSTPTMADPMPPLPWQADLDRLIARIEQDLARNGVDRPSDTPSEYLRKQTQLRLLCLMSQNQEDALTAIPGINASEQEYWQQMLLAMSNSMDTNQFPEASERAAQIVAPLSAALRQVRENAPLAIKNMGFCRKISYFGNYERFPRNEFTPGQEVLLYTEIENFVSNATTDGEYRTSLKSLVEIVDFDGKVVWTKGFPPTEDLCRNPRRDYFHNYQFHIPKELSTGTYSLKLTIEDELSHKRTSNSLNFVLK